MRTAGIVAVGLSLISSGNALAQRVSECKFKTCSGGTPVLHDDNGYRFETSSIVYPMRGTGRVIYQTCVENKSDRDFEIKWYIPGPDSWLLRGCALKSPRQKIKQDTVDGYKSCLRYGNQWLPGSAEFVPHRTDTQAIEDEKRKGCKQLIAEDARQQASNSSGNEKIDTAELRIPVTEELEAFAPFDPKEPSSTMVHIVAHVSLEPSESLKSFKHIIRWDVAKAYESGPTYRGNLSVRPENPILRQAYQKIFGTDAAVPLDAGKPFIAEFEMPARPNLVSVRYRFLSPAGVPVASIFVPMWLADQ